MLFSKLSDDVVLTIFAKLEEDPRNWARLSCVCTKFTSLIRSVCCKSKCKTSIPSVVSDLLSDSPSSIPGGWSSLYKLAVCCPGLVHSGVLLENSDFGLERELGPDENYHHHHHHYNNNDKIISTASHHQQPESSTTGNTLENPDSTWSLYDDLYYDTVYDASESQDVPTANTDDGVPMDTTTSESSNSESSNKTSDILGGEFSVCKKRKLCCRSLRSHLASGVWNLSREQGNKLLASRFREDCLYICDWPGCLHREEKRNYMLFRGIFKNFKRSRVWRTINDGNRSKIPVNCAFCACKETWDLHSAFCFRRGFGYHDDGEPVVRAYVCENGHVSGAWTDLPLYA